MTRVLRFFLVVGILAVTLAVVGDARASAAPPVRYDLALGDSLSRGVQPNARGVSLETNEGYAEQLFQIERRRIPGLRLVQLGCPGETTGSMITGHGNADAGLFHCRPAGGSQLKAAERFLRAHHRRGEVAFVTIDIGANDVDGCAAPGVNLAACVAKGEASIAADLPVILDGIRHAAAAGTPLVGMTLYDPVLAAYFNADASVRSLVDVSIAVLEKVNAEIASADRAAGFRTADVAGAFESYNLGHLVPFNGQMVPVNVVRVCSWTWACTPPPNGTTSPIGNIHANDNGYAVIAQAFAHALGSLR